MKKLIALVMGIGLASFCAVSCGQAQGSSSSTPSFSSAMTSQSPSFTPAALAGYSNITISGQLNVALHIPSGISCTEGPLPPSNQTGLSISLPTGSLYLGVANYRGVGSYPASAAVSQDGGTAVLYVDSSLGTSRPVNEYDATSGTISVTAVHGNDVFGSVNAHLTPFGTAPGSLTVAGTWSCVLAASSQP